MTADQAPQQPVGQPLDDGSLVADVCHELRGRATTLLNAVALLERHRRHLPPDGQEVLGLLDEEMHRFRDLLVELVEMARDDADARTRAAAPVPVCHLVGAVLARHLPEGVGEVLRIDDGVGDVVVRVDRVRVERALENLLDNAREHGGGVVAVQLSRDRGQIVVAVDDAGPGVPPAERERVFARFVSREGSDGNGLGLAVAARCARSSGGSLSVGQSPFGGARFSLALPVLQGVPRRR